MYLTVVDFRGAIVTIAPLGGLFTRIFEKCSEYSRLVGKKNSLTTKSPHPLENLVITATGKLYTE